MRNRFRIGFSLLLPALLAACAGTPDTSDRAWPFYSAEKTAEGGGRTDVLWPIWQELESPERREVRVRPVYRRIEEGDETTVEVLWPLFSRYERPGREKTRVFPFFFHQRYEDPGGAHDMDWGLFPILYGGSDTEEGDYFLFFPFWGNLKGLLAKDEMRFRFFPLYLDTHEDDGYDSTHLIWPIVSWGDGGGRSDFRILPFYSHRESEGKSEYTSVMWPFVSWGRAALDTEHPSTNFLFFPFYGQIESDVAWSRTVLFPLYMGSGAEGGYRDLNLLWPIFRSRTGPDGPQALRVWPLFSRTHDEEKGVKEDWYLWPFVWDTDIPNGAGRFRNFQVVPVWRSTTRTNPDGTLRDRELQVWPLFKRREGGDGSVRLTALAPIPFVDLESFEASWDWLWTILDHRSAAGGSSTDLLFGLIQHRTSAEGTYAGLSILLEYASRREATKVEVLKGLLGWEEDAAGSGVRLLWFLRIGF